VLLLFPPSSLTAQGTLDSIARRLEPGQVLRLAFSGQGLEGRFSHYTLDPPALRFADGESSVSLARIDSLWVRGNAAGRGAAIGALILGTPAAILMVALCGIGGSDFEVDCVDARAIAFIGVAAGSGALLGAAVGSASPRWHRLYATPSAAIGLTPLRPNGLGVGISIPFSIGGPNGYSHPLAAANSSGRRQAPLRIRDLADRASIPSAHGGRSLESQESPCPCASPFESRGLRQLPC